MNRIVEEAEWMDAYARQVAQEKAATEALDRIAADRRRLPWPLLQGSASRPLPHSVPMAYFVVPTDHPTTTTYTARCTSAHRTT